MAGDTSSSYAVPFGGELQGLPGDVSNILAIQQFTEPIGSRFESWGPNGQLILGRKPIGFRVAFSGEDRCVWDPPSAQPIPSDADLGPTVSVDVGSVNIELRRVQKGDALFYLWEPLNPWPREAGDDSWIDGGIVVAGHAVGLDVPPSIVPIQWEQTKNEFLETGTYQARWIPAPQSTSAVVFFGYVEANEVRREFFCEFVDDGIADVTLNEGAPEHLTSALARFDSVEADIPGIGLTYVVVFRDFSWGF